MRMKPESFVFILWIQSQMQIFRLAPINENRLNEAFTLLFHYIYYMAFL